jgi:hypothetical protein
VQLNGFGVNSENKKDHPNIQVKNRQDDSDANTKDGSGNNSQVRLNGSGVNSENKKDHPNVQVKNGQDDPDANRWETGYIMHRLNG